MMGNMHRFMDVFLSFMESGMESIYQQINALIPMVDGKHVESFI